MAGPLLPILVVASAVGLGYRYLTQDKEADEVSNDQLRESLRESRKQVKLLTQEKNRRKASGNWFDQDQEDDSE